MDLASIQLEAWVVALLAGPAVAILTGLATRLQADGGLKALVAAGFTALIAAVDSVVYTNGAFFVRDLLVLFVTTFTWHVAAYWGFLKHVGDGAAPGALITADLGVG